MYLSGHVFLLLLFALLGKFERLAGQSFELMPGHERVFVDVQWLKPVWPDRFDLTAFSRTRAAVDYENQSDIFSAFYLNYTFKPGIGPTALAALSGDAGVVPSVGVHYFLNTKPWTVFVLLSTELERNGDYSLFSISRFQPELTEVWALYFSLELYSVMNGSRHVVSLQRIRAGTDYRAWQFGLGINLTELGKGGKIHSNFGPFLRRTF